VQNNNRFNTLPDGVTGPSLEEQIQRIMAGAAEKGKTIPIEKVAAALIARQNTAVTTVTP
jgi:hypothetical protein